MTPLCSAAHFIPLHHLGMNLMRHGHPLARLRMALHTRRVGIGLVQLGLLVGRTPIMRIIVPNMAHAPKFCIDGPKHSIIGMTSITTLMPEIARPGVNGRKRIALGILRILHIRRHHMARSTEFALLGCLQVGVITEQSGCNGERSQPEEKSQAGIAIESGAAEEITDKQQSGEPSRRERAQGEHLRGVSHLAGIIA